eukprot:484416_1
MKIRRDLFCNKNCLMNSFPICQWLPSYKLSYLKSDILAGVTVSILLVPQSLAYAILAGLPPVWGLYTSTIPVILYVIFGTSTQVALGTVAATCIMIASAVEAIMIKYGYEHETDPGYSELYQSLVITLTFVCGIIRILFGLFRAGFIVVFLSRPVMTGFIFSVALIILINQFRGLFGLDIDRYPLFYETLIAVITNLNTINAYNTLISLASLFILFLPKWIKTIPKWIPMPLIVIVIFCMTSYFIGINKLESVGISLIGNDIKSGLPSLRVPNLKYIGDVWSAAFIIAVVSYMGSIALAKEFEQKKNETYKQKLSIYNKWYNQFHVSASQIPLVQIAEDDKEHQIGFHHENDNCEESDDDKVAQSELSDNQPIKPISLAEVELNANMEFIAYGIADIIGCFFSAMIVSASFSRSALNYEMNGCTQISSIVQAIIGLFCLFFLMSLLAPLPKCVLAAVVTISVYRLIKNGIYEFIFLFNVSKIELVEFIIACISPLIIGLEYGILISMISSIIVNLLRRAFPSIKYLGQLQSKDTDHIEYVDLNDESFENEPTKVSQITIIEMTAELAFINNKRLVDKLRVLLSEGHKYIIVSLRLTSFMDTTAIRHIVSIFEDAKSAYICLSQCNSQVMELIHRYETDEHEFPSNIKLFVSTHDAVQYLEYIYSLSTNGDDEYDDEHNDNIAIERVTYVQHGYSTSINLD